MNLRQISNNKLMLTIPLVIMLLCIQLLTSCKPKPQAPGY